MANIGIIAAPTQLRPTIDFGVGILSALAVDLLLFAAVWLLI